MIMDTHTTINPNTLCTFFQHEGWSWDFPWPNDIAIMKLAEPIRLTDPTIEASLACLPVLHDADFTQDECWITGWGLQDGNFN